MMLARYYYASLAILLALPASAEPLTPRCQQAIDQQQLEPIVKACSSEAQSGNTEAAYRIGEAFDFSQAPVETRFQQALYWYNVAAQAGHPLAQRNLASLYDSGRGPLRDTFKAFHWYQKAAEQGQPHSQLMTGMMYLYGSGTPQDVDKAKHWFKQAALSGEPNGEYMYGKIIFPEDPDQAVKWYKKAAVQNNGYALYQLGLLHYLDQYPLSSESEALDFAERAIAAGHDKASVLKEKLLARQQQPGIAATNSTQSQALPTNQPTTSHAATSPSITEHSSKVDRIIPSREQTASKATLKAASAVTLTPKNTGKAKESSISGAEWLQSQPAHHYTIQLALMSQPDSIQRFARFYPSVTDTHSYASAFPKGTLYVLVKGSYDTLAKAKAALQDLPEKVRKTKPWIRQFKTLQSQYVKPE